MTTPVLTIPQFIAMIATAKTMLAPKRAALEAAAVMIETEAQRVIGTYDYHWPELAQSTQDQRKHLGFSENDPLLRNGRLRAAIEHSSDHTRADVGVKDAMVGSGTTVDPYRNIGDVAVAQELGTSKIPARSYLMGAAIAKEKDVVKLIGRQVAAKLFVR